MTSAAKSSAIFAVELALAVLTLAKRGWQFDGAQTAATGRQDVEQDLEALRGQRRRQRFENIAPDHEMTAHRIGEIDPEHQTHQPVRPPADARTLLGKASRRAAVEIAAGDGEIGAPAAQAIEHANEQAFVMLQIGIHHRDVARLA